MGFEKAILAGTSGGAVVAMHLAASYPEMVKALALDSFSLHFTEDMFKKNVLNQRSAPTKEQENFWRYCHGEDLRQVIAWDTKNIERMVENGGNWLEDTPGKIKCPALLLGSRADSYIPDIENDFKQLSKKITNNKLVFSQTRDHPLIWTNTKFYQNELFKSLGMDILE